MATPIDCLVVGSGPAGLTAGLYLARFRREVTVFDGGRSRAQWIPMARNIAGWPEGVSGRDFLDRARRQAEAYGARFEAANVIGLDACETGFEAVLADGRRLVARSAILATGVAEIEPAIADFDAGVERGVVNLCPICDGFEAHGKRVAVLGVGEHAAAEALFLRTFAQEVDLYLIGAMDLPAEVSAELERAAVATEPAPERIEVERDGVRVGARFYDRLYSALGVTSRGELAARLGARPDEDGRLVVDRHQQTSVPGLYAAGDLVRGLNQISVAMAEAAIAATAVHNRLPACYA